MGQVSKIQWTDATFNPWIGCTKVSDGCKFCYAEADMDNRRKRVTWGINGTRSVTSYAYWRKVLSWDRDAKNAGERRKVFCASLADVFEDWKGNVIDSKNELLLWPQYETFDEFESRNDLLEGTVFSELQGNLRFSCSDCDDIPTFSHLTQKQIDIRFNHNYGDKRLNENSMYNKSFFKPLTIDIIRLWLFKLIEKTESIDWLLLTKRPENIMKMIPEHWGKKFPSNVWIGTSCENQETADERIPHLLKIPASIRFLSCEPLLGPITLPDHLAEGSHSINWIIVGAESGSKARIMNNFWADSLRIQTMQAGASFFMKQICHHGKPIPFDVFPTALQIREFPNI